MKKWVVWVIFFCFLLISVLLTLSDPMVYAALYRAYHRVFTQSRIGAGATGSYCSQPLPVQITPQSAKQALEQRR